MRLLSYNIRHGGVGREERLAEVIRQADPDVVVFQEATRPIVIERLAATTGMRVCGSRPRTSLGFMSRVEIGEHAWHQPRLSRHAFLEIALAGSRFRIFGVHLSAVHSAWTERHRMFELRALLAAIRHHQEGAHVLAGDFNTLAPGELLDIRRLPHRLRALVWLSGGKVRWRTIQLILEAGYTDAYRRLHADPGWTFPTWNPHIRLDYVFIAAASAERVKECRVIDTDAAKAASDHFPLLAEIDVD